MIEVKFCPFGDTRTCDYKSVPKEALRDASVEHIADVGRALAFFQAKLTEAAVNHDTDKLTDIDSFHADFLTGFESVAWWGRHRKLNRHHLLHEDGIPADVNLIDVLDYLSDCVMAGKARSGGKYYSPEIAADVLMRAFKNTVALLESQVTVTP